MASGTLALPPPPRPAATGSPTSSALRRVAVALCACCALPAGCGGAGRSFQQGFDAGAASPDFAHAASPADLGSAAADAAAPFTDSGAPRFGCASDFQCYVANKCADQGCLGTCDAMVNTADGKKLVEQYLACLYTTACPNQNSGVCDQSAPKFSVADCNACLMNAKATTCKAQTQACAQDG